METEFSSVMSPSGTLLAYSTPANIKELRDQATLISMAWKDHKISMEAKARETSQSADGSENASGPKTLETLTIEFDHANLIVRAIQANLLLVLVGDVPSGRSDIFNITPEETKDPRYPPADTTIPTVDTNETDKEVVDDKTSESQIGHSPSIDYNDTQQQDKESRLGLLHVQREKVDALCDFIRCDFDSKGFVMPYFP